MYSAHVKEPVGKARLEGVDASYKDLVEVCNNVRGKSIDFALDLLEKAARGEMPLRFYRYNKKLGHRKELGGKKGRYPKKAAKIVLKVIKSAIASARQKGLSDDLYVFHIAANKKNEYARVASKGRWAYSNYVTARVEVILKEKSKRKQKTKEEAKKPKNEKGGKV